MRLGGPAHGIVTKNCTQNCQGVVGVGVGGCWSRGWLGSKGWWGSRSDGGLGVVGV